MNTKKVTPSIHIPIQKPDGSMEWVWYIFLQWLTDNFGNYFTKEEIIEMLEDYFTKEEIAEILGNYFTKEEINEMLTAYALDDNVVHKTGNETISDKKTFIGTSNSWELPICIKNTNTHAIADQVPTGSTGKGISFVDKNGVLDGYIEFYRHESQSRYLSLNITQNNQFYSCIAIGFNNNGDVFTRAPTPNVASNDTNIATTAFVNNFATQNLAKLSTDNVFTGYNKFDYGSIWIKTPFFYNQYVVSWQTSDIIFADSNGNGVGVFTVGRNQFDETMVLMNVRDTNGAWASDYVPVLQLGFSGHSVYTKAPPCDWQNSIVTTIANIKSANGYFKLGNGLILQWGWCDTRFSTSRTITFPTAFSSTTYVVSAIPFIVANLAVYQLGFSNRTTTTVNINSSGAANDYEFAWLAIGY